MPLHTLLPTLVSCLIAACASGPDASPPPDPRCEAPRGDVSQLEAPAGPRDLYGFELYIDRPVFCGASAYIAVRGEGHRRFAILPDDAAPETCPGRPAPDDPCVVVDPTQLGAEVVDRLRGRGVAINGLGMGACGQPGDTYATWNMSVGVMDWADADAALNVVADRLRAWRIGDTFGVTVRPLSCGVPLEDE